MDIRGIDWLFHIIEKLLTKHSVAQFEVEEVFDNQPRFRFVERGDRVVVKETQSSSISKASSYEEMGEFWDTHGLEDYWDQTYQADFKVSKVLQHKVYLDPKMYDRAKSAAKRQSVSIEVIVRKWLEEQLIQEGKPKAAARVDKVVRSE